MATECECGCGGFPRATSRFIKGHNRRKSPVDYIVDGATGCWVWQLKLSRGYGRAWRDGCDVPAHRWHYEQAMGAVPDGLELDHLCRNRACVNPAHLEPVTKTENVRRSSAAKLTEREVRMIRLNPEGLSQRVLGARYGVHQTAISAIVRRVNWPEVGVV